MTLNFLILHRILTIMLEAPHIGQIYKVFVLEWQSINMISLMRSLIMNLDLMFHSMDKIVKFL